ncbi:MAG: DNA methyltransferase [Candidatus Kariarchaeaceae archaeon]
MKWLLKTACESKGLVKEEINTLGQRYPISWLHDCLVIIETSEKEILDIANKSAVVKMILRDPIVLDKMEIISFIENNQFPKNHLDNEYIKPSGQFVVRHEHTGNMKQKLPTEWIERNMGANILGNRKDLSVNLTNPDFEYYIITWKYASCLGWVHERISYQRIAARAPKMGPYFRGGGMKPRLCRLLVNLLQPLSSVILDPFCGHGGILRELADLGSFGVGIEINKKLCRELLANNRHFGYEDVIAIIMGDSIKSPLRMGAYDQAITDPPYAIQTTTKGLDREELILKWLQVQNKGLKLVFTTPDTMLLNLPSAWKVDIDEEDFVHKSLTRRIRRISN